MEYSESTPKKASRFSRGRKRIGKLFTDSYVGVKKNWRYLVAGAVIIIGAENRSAVVGAIREHPVKVTGELKAEPKPLAEETIHVDNTTDFIFPAVYEGIIRTCEPIENGRSEICHEDTVFTTAEDSKEGRVKRDGNKLTVEKQLVDAERPYTIVHRER
jgi:hypothetical protein